MAKKQKTKAKSKLTVLRTIESFYPFMSGPANQAYRISSELEKRGIKSPVLTTNYKAGKAPRHQKIKGVEVFRFPIRWGFMKYLITPSMRKKLSKFDIIHAHNHRSYQTAIAFKAAKKYGKPFIINTHGSLLGYDHYLKGLAKIPYVIYDLFGGKNLIKKADAVIVNSNEEYLDALRYGVKKSKIHLLPVGINVNDYSPLKKQKNTVKILFVGRISRNRNIEPIIRAAAILKNKKQKQKIIFTIVGGEAKSSDTSKSGYLAEMKLLTKNISVDDIVQFVGEKRGDELKKEYRTADIFVYTSDSENFGQTILEAGASGLPIICTPVGIAPELITDGKNGFLVKA
ncbi:MAG: glycosyltransferase family 4 protein, partial [archaeon]|nr:glycosyltransferase family 4 protein [archaeon]